MARSMDREEPGRWLWPGATSDRGAEQATTGDPGRVAAIEGQIRRKGCYAWGVPRPDDKPGQRQVTQWVHTVLDDQDALVLT